MQEIPAHERSTTLDNRGQIYEWVTQRISRDTLHEQYGISPLVSHTQVLLDLTRAGLLTITRTKAHGAHTRSSRHLLRVTIPNRQSARSLTFTALDKEGVYDNLKTTLYPIHAPSDRQFRAHLSAHASRQLADTPKEEVVDLLVQTGLITIEES
jgi:hypothetical protein